jgi:2-polyprenyl-3-methyl-5-hydroxy-6-metoxy-1,4-benzoquinol methylase
MNQRWPWTERFVKGITETLKEHGIEGGNVLNLCCGNGRIAIYMAKKGFNVTGIDYSKPCIDDAKRRAEEENVGNRTTFIEGDVRDLIYHLSKRTEKFDVVVSAWTSIGYNTVEDDCSIFGQSR